MRRLRTVLAVCWMGLLVLVASSPATAADPQAVNVSIAIARANGFVPVSEFATGQGTVVDTFQSPDATVKALGTAGSVISFFPNQGTPATAKSAAHGGLMVEMKPPARPKTLADANAYRDSGRTVVGDLVALGMPRADAERDFGDMETMDGTNPYLLSPTNNTSTPTNWYLAW